MKKRAQDAVAVKESENQKKLPEEKSAQAEEAVQITGQMQEADESDFEDVEQPVEVKTREEVSENDDFEEVVLPAAEKSETAEPEAAEEDDDFEDVLPPAGEIHIVAGEDDGQDEEDFEDVDPARVRPVASSDAGHIEVSSDDDFDPDDNPFDYVPRHPVQKIEKTPIEKDLERILGEDPDAAEEPDTRTETEKYLEHLEHVDDEAYREAEARVTRNPAAAEVRARAMRSAEEDLAEQQRILEEQKRQEKERRKQDKRRAKQEKKNRKKKKKQARKNEADEEAPFLKRALPKDSEKPEPEKISREDVVPDTRRERKPEVDEKTGTCSRMSQCR